MGINIEVQNALASARSEMGGMFEAEKLSELALALELWDFDITRVAGVPGDWDDLDGVRAWLGGVGGAGNGGAEVSAAPDTEAAGAQSREPEDSGLNGVPSEAEAVAAPPEVVPGVGFQGTGTVVTPEPKESRFEMMAARKYFEQQRAARKPPQQAVMETAKVVVDAAAKGHTRVALPKGSVVTGLREALGALGYTDPFTVGIATGVSLDAKQSYASGATPGSGRGGLVVVLGGGAA